MQLTQFHADHLYDASLAFFKGLNMPVKELGKQTYDAQQLLDDKFLPNNEAHQLLNDIYLIGLIDDDAFQGIEKGKIEEIENYKEYDGILILAVELKDRPNNLLPTRTHLSQLTRAFNRKFPTTPAVIIYRYDQYIAFANVERLAYKQEWKQAEGEKAGKVSLLRDVKIADPHTGHLKILNGIKINEKGKKPVKNLDALYKHWQEVFSVSILSKAFYEELFHWYLWAVRNVTFPNKPTLESVVKRYGKIDTDKLEELIQEHKAKNIIRLLTRILFVWFIKEKGLIPNELFDLDALQKEILNDISPYKQVGLLKESNNESIYYKAILQNLFFAVLNCPIEPTSETGDTRKRGFRKKDNYGQDRGVDYLMRNEKYFQNPDSFLKLVNDKVPFLNGGLFECLDEKDNNLYIDGFSDNMKKGEQLIVPDFLFFGHADTVNLSKEYGIKKKGTEKAAVKGLIGILESYKFTIAENTPVEEDIALDPELLGKVFENLLASYNPETKTTARKQTGSFYTPREIVDYMVDESLIAYLKTKILQEGEGYAELGKLQGDLFGNKAKMGQLSLESKIDESKWKGKEELLDTLLHQLFSYDSINPFAKDEETTLEIIRCLDSCKILDPACGSGAFPMGVLQKMVHILGKLDKRNKYWRNKQITKVRQKMQEEDLSKTDIKEIREQLIDIEKAFDENDSDYSRKLFLIENCIYGVDIQPIATQISKLRFFISLIVDQNVDGKAPKSNFGVRPLPNLETKFVTANTLIGIEKPDSQLSLFETSEVKKLEAELKKVRHKIFSVKSKKTKTKYKLKDKELRQGIANKLIEIGWATTTATQLADWDPFDQNYIAPFFDMEWMFGIKSGFDIVIGNPPYIKEETNRKAFNGFREKSPYYQGKMDLWYGFTSQGIDNLSRNGHICFIATNNWITNAGASKIRNKILSECHLKQFLDFYSYMIFESASIQTMIFLIKKGAVEKHNVDYRKITTANSNFLEVLDLLKKKNVLEKNQIGEVQLNSEEWLGKPININSPQIESILKKIELRRNFRLDGKSEIASGIDVLQDFVNKKSKATLGDKFEVGEGIFNLSHQEKENMNLNPLELKDLIKPFYTTNELSKYYGSKKNKYWIIYTNSSFKDEKKIIPYPNLKAHLDKFKKILTSVNAPYGLHRSRKEYFFKDEKIFSVRKCKEPTFSYTDFDCYVSRAFMVIKSERICQQYLAALLNSTLVKFWLRYRGKLQGNLFQVDKTPILSIPICDDKVFKKTVKIIFQIIKRIRENNDVLKNMELVNNSIILELYFPNHLKEKKINILSYIVKDLEEVLKSQDFEQLQPERQEQAVEELYKRWSNPNSEIQKRIGLFKERSPDILKPILESR